MEWRLQPVLAADVSRRKLKPMALTHGGGHGAIKPIYGSGLHPSLPTLLPLPIGSGADRGEGISELRKGAFSNRKWYKEPQER